MASHNLCTALLLALVAASACSLAAGAREGPFSSTLWSTVTSFLRPASDAPRADAAAASHHDDGPWFCHGLDCPEYDLDDVLEGSVELRRYSAGMWVSTNVSGVHYDQATGVGFTRLFQYISGANAELKRIEMTAPVRVLVLPGEGPFCEDRYTVSFFVPPELQSNPPEPASDKVFLEHSPAACFYVWSYPGFTSESRVLKQARDTLTRLDRAGLEEGKDYCATYFYSAGYDSPFRLTNRHNEIWIPAL